MSSEDYVNDPLWSILVDTVHKLVLYQHHKAYIERVILSERPTITYRDLASLMGISEGEAMVVLHDLKIEAEHIKPNTDK